MAQGLLDCSVKPGNDSLGALERAGYAERWIPGSRSRAPRNNEALLGALRKAITA
jgi:hypothetical protein